MADKPTPPLLVEARRLCAEILRAAVEAPETLTFWRGTDRHVGGDGWVSHTPNGNWGVTINVVHRTRKGG